MTFQRTVIRKEESYRSTAKELRNIVLTVFPGVFTLKILCSLIAISDNREKIIVAS